MNYLTWLGVGLYLLALSASAKPPMALVLPGGWSQWGDRASEVRQWEADNSDIVFGSVGRPQLNRANQALGYMYAHKLDCFPNAEEAPLYRAIWQQGLHPEGLFLHFAEDTRLRVETLTEPERALLEGKPLHVMQQHGQVLQTARFPLQVRRGDALLVVSAQPFVMINAPNADKMTVTVASADEPAALIADWSEMEGQALTEARWQPSEPLTPVLPRTRTYHFNTGHAALSADLPVYLLRLTWSEPVVVDKIALDYGPRLLGDDEVMIPGWNAKADTNQDGYIDDDEWLTQRGQPLANARYASQARVIPFGHVWAGSCWIRTDQTNAALNPLRQQWYWRSWQRQGMSGAYNDDMAKLLGENMFSLQTGGQISEIPAVRVGSDTASRHYALGLAAFLTSLKSAASDKERDAPYRIAANISELNLWRYPAWPTELRDTIDVVLREHYLFGAMGLQALQLRWEHFALSAMGKQSLVMTTTRFGRSGVEPGSVQAWQQDIATGLALYYLFHLPNQTYYHSWNQTFYYGSGPTDTENWYQAGQVKNQVYRPEGMLQHELGAPQAALGQPVPWLIKDEQEAMAVLSLLQQMPADWFYLPVKGAGAYQAIGRAYAHGLVVYVAKSSWARPEDYHDAPLEIELPKAYQQVNWEGTLQPAATTVTLAPYSGAVLLLP
uniref:hypothetical protein n=1 Tax=Thaumasiovibrio occultus TaxID=1891184 RepID=UPI000B35BF6C|nr:hypothetical protein [Thaumasiovibrio occultus]